MNIPRSFLFSSCAFFKRPIVLRRGSLDLGPPSVSRVLDHDRLFRSEPGMLEQIPNASFR